MMAGGALLVYDWIATHVSMAQAVTLTTHSTQKRPVVETPYLAFGLLMAPPALAILLLGSAICAWAGKKFDPPPASRLHRFQTLMFGLSLKTLLYVVPALMILTTVALLARGYSPCSNRAALNEAWQLIRREI